MNAPRTLASLVLAGLLSGCASVVPYTPKETVLDERAPGEAQSLLETTVARAIEPRIASAHADPNGDSLHYVYIVVDRGPFGIPVGNHEEQMQLFYVNIDRIDVYDNHYVYVYGNEHRLLAKLLFDSAADAKSFADLMMSFRAQRIYGGERPESWQDSQ
jgi:hypothetical protein